MGVLVFWISTMTIDSNVPLIINFKAERFHDQTKCHDDDEKDSQERDYLNNCFED